MQRVIQYTILAWVAGTFGCTGAPPPHADCEGEACPRLMDGGTEEDDPFDLFDPETGEASAEITVDFPAVRLDTLGMCGGGDTFRECANNSCDDCRGRGFVTSCAGGKCMWCNPGGEPGCGSLGDGFFTRPYRLDFPGDDTDWICDFEIVTTAYENPGQDQCDEDVDVLIDGTYLDSGGVATVPDQCNDSGSDPRCSANRRLFCPKDTLYTTRIRGIQITDPPGTDDHTVELQFPGGSVNVVRYRIYNCVPEIVCGDGRVDPPEEMCDPPGTDSTQCPQSTSGCEGNRYWTRDALGNCDDECGCVEDPYVAQCVAGQCGAECGPPGDDSADCPQETSGCIGPRYWERDPFGACTSECGCNEDPIDEQCVPGQCGAACATDADCDDGSSVTTDLCNGECGCEHEGGVDLGCMPDEPTANDAALAEAQRIVGPTCGSATYSISRSGPLCSSSFLVQADGCGHSFSLTFDAKIDGTPPTITPGVLGACFPNVDSALAAASSVTTVTDNCPGPVDTSYTLDASAGLCSASIRVDAVDACGNRSSHVYEGVRIDAAPPVLTAGTLPACFPDEASALAAALAATTVTENCPGVSVDARIEGTSLCSATIVVTAVDACGNVATPVRYTNVSIDAEPPVLIPGVIDGCFPDEASALAAALAATSVSENCPGVSLDAFLDPSSDLCNATITVTAVDACGNRATPIQYDNVRIDATPPVLSPGTLAACYPDEATALAAAIAATTVSENCPGVVVDAALDPTTDVCDATIIVTAVDGCGLAATPLLYTNVIIDGEPPVLSTNPSPAEFDETLLCDPAGPYRPLASDPIRGNEKNWVCFDFDDQVTVTDNCSAEADPTHLLVECNGTGLTELPVTELDSCNGGHVVPRGDPADPTGFCLKLNGFLRPPTGFFIRYQASDACGLTTTEDLEYTVTSFPNGGCR